MEEKAVVQRPRPPSARRAHDDWKARSTCARVVRRFTRKWKGHAGRAPARVNPTWKRSLI